MGRIETTAKLWELETVKFFLHKFQLLKLMEFEREIYILNKITGGQASTKNYLISLLFIILVLIFSKI